MIPVKDPDDLYQNSMLQDFFLLLEKSVFWKSDNNHFYDTHTS